MNYILPIIITFVTINNVRGLCQTTKDKTTCDDIVEVLHNWKRYWINLVVKGNINEPKTYDIRSENLLNTSTLLENFRIEHQLRSISPNFFKYRFNRLTNLDIVNNEINVIKSKTFSGLNLEKLNLQNNNISVIESNAFQGSNITSLDLSNNSISSINQNELQIEDLLTLKIDRNFLRHLDANCFPSTLTNLSLTNNNMKIINLEAFHNLRNLKYLNLSHNKFIYVTKIPSLKNLETIDLSYNEISTIEKESFVPYKKLKNLYLRSNKLMTLLPNIFPPNSEIRLLDISYNILPELSEQLGDVLPNLQVIYIWGNPWHCKCLKIMEQFFAANGIQKSQCENDAFGKGEMPICLVYSDSCSSPSSYESVKNEVEQFMANIGKIIC